MSQATQAQIEEKELVETNLVIKTRYLVPRNLVYKLISALEADDCRKNTVYILISEKEIRELLKLLNKERPEVSSACSVTSTDFDICHWIWNVGEFKINFDKLISKKSLACLDQTVWVRKYEPRKV